MTRSSIKFAIRSVSLRLDELPKELMGAGEGHVHAELRVPPSMVDGDASQKTGGFTVPRIPDSWLTQEDRFHVYQHAINEPFAGQIVDLGQEEHVTLYSVQKDPDRSLLLVTHFAWDSIRSVQLIKLLKKPKKNDLPDADID